MNSKLKVIKCQKDCESKFRKPFPLLRILSPDGRGPFPSVSVNEKVMEVAPPFPRYITLFSKKKHYFPKKHLCAKRTYFLILVN